MNHNYFINSIILSSKLSKKTISSSNRIIVEDIAFSLKDRFWDIDIATKRNIDKILKCFKDEKIDESAFHGVNGYGFGDIGREKTDNIIARLMGAESAHVRLQFFSGTHAISTALFASLKPGDRMLCVSGTPYDTLEEVIGIRGDGIGSLTEWGIKYDQIDMKYNNIEINNNNNSDNDIYNGNSCSSSSSGKEAIFDYDLIGEYIDNCNSSGSSNTDNDKDSNSNGNSNSNDIKLIHVQRSCGYSWRPSILIKEIEKLVHFVKVIKKRGDITIFVDNCYGELVEDQEPCHVGVDLVAGSLIKNLGGTLAPSGGYVAGRNDLVQRVAKHLAAPGVEGGATFNQYKDILQGLFLSPVIIGESLKGAELVSHLFTQLGYECNPAPGQQRTDIIQAVRLEDRDRLIQFCEITQSLSPVGSHVRPIPGSTAGYEDDVIFADGTFVEGSTLELSADGPLREPYVAYIQGCTHWSHWALVLEKYLNSIQS